MNQVNLTGRITKDLELRMTQNEKQVCVFSIAVDRGITDGTDFINIECWNKLPENLCKYQTKGDMIGVVGNLRVEQYKNQNGENRYKTYVLANQIDFLGSRKKEEEKTSSSAKFAHIENEQVELDTKEDYDLPF